MEMYLSYLKSYIDYALDTPFVSILRFTSFRHFTVIRTDQNLFMFGSTLLYLALFLAKPFSDCLTFVTLIFIPIYRVKYEIKETEVQNLPSFLRHLFREKLDMLTKYRHEIFVFHFGSIQRITHFVVRF